MVRAAIAVLLLMLASSAALAEKRVALLIGNKDYKPGVGALVNPINDIRVVGDALKAVGFEVLKPTQNATRTTMLLAVHDFAAKLSAAGADAVGFLYYSGHGIASAGENYLVPIDIDEPSTRLLSVQGVKHNEVLAILRGEAPNAAHYLVLDACRNTLQGARGGKGFVPVGQQSGVLVAFAAEPGKTASDTGAGSGPYAAALAAELVKPGQNDLLMFHRVRVAVMDKTNGDQVPWTEDGIQRRERVLFGGENKPASSTPVPEVTEAAREWARVDKASVAELETFVRRHAKSPEADYAKARIDALRPQQVAVAAPPKVPAPAPSKPAQPAAAIKPPPLPALCVGVEPVVGNERRCLKPGSGKTEWFKDCPTCSDMVVVPAGRFTMGSPKDEPERFENETEDLLSVAIGKPFAVGRFAVTRREFAAFVASTGHKSDGGCSVYKPARPQSSGSPLGTEWKQLADASWRSVGFSQTDRHPVVCVDWNDAKAYVAWLSSTTGKSYRLLSESEREYVARAGTTTPFWWGSSITPALANYNGTAEPYLGGGSKGEWRKATVPVDSFPANPWGLFNVHGNVLEWVEDCWNEKNAGNPGNGSARTSGDWDCAAHPARVLRGGSWGDDPRYLRSANRIWLSIDRFDFVGFRVARTLD